MTRNVKGAPPSSKIGKVSHNKKNTIIRCLQENKKPKIKKDRTIYTDFKKLWESL